MAKRIKSTDHCDIENWDQADQAVKEVADMQNKIEIYTATSEETIRQIKDKNLAIIKPLQNKIKSKTLSLEIFAKQNKKSFGKSRSRKLNFGIVGWRQSFSISISKKTTLDLIKSVFRSHYKKYLNIKETVNKTSLKPLTDEQLSSIGARRKIKDVFYVEPYAEAMNEDTDKD